MSQILQNMITQRAQNLDPTLKKQVAKLAQKIFNTNYYPDAKKLAKMREIATEPLIAFLLECARDYEAAHASLFRTSEHDVCTLRGVWTAMSFSRDAGVLNYLQEQVKSSCMHRGFAHRYIFEILRLHEAAHPLLPELNAYYDGLKAKLPIYELLRRIGVALADEYAFYISLSLVNFDKWFSDQGLDDVQKARKFWLDLHLHNPFIYDHTFDISLSNSDVPRVRVDFNDDGANFIQRADANAFVRPEVLNLKPFLASAQSYFGIKFSAADLNDKDKCCLLVSKGINRGKVMAWLATLFE